MTSNMVVENGARQRYKHGLNMIKHMWIGYINDKRTPYNIHNMITPTIRENGKY